MPSWKTFFVAQKRPTPAEKDYAYLNDGRYAKREQIIVTKSNPVPIHIGPLQRSSSCSGSASSQQQSPSHSHDDHRIRGPKRSHKRDLTLPADYHHWRGVNVPLSESHRSTSSISVRFGEVMYDCPQTPNQPSTARYNKPPRSIMKHSAVSETSLACNGLFLHPLLVYPDGRLRYQILRHPTTRSITVGSPAVCMPEVELLEPATHPPTQAPITIICQRLPWTISVRAGHRRKSKGEDPHTQRDYIRVCDVLLALHTSLAKPISRNEWESLSREQQMGVTRAYERRCKGMGGEQWELGVRRVDWLRRRVYFAGLLPAGTNEDGQVWEAVFLDERT